MTQIKIDEAQLNKEFDALLDKMYYQYHYFPTNIPNFNNPKYDADARFFTALTNTLSKNGSGNNDYCNGLPVNRRSSQVYTSDHGSGEGIGGGACLFLVIFAVVFIGMFIFALSVSGG